MMRFISLTTTMSAAVIAGTATAQQIIGHRCTQANHAERGTIIGQKHSPELAVRAFVPGRVSCAHELSCRPQKYCKFLQFMSMTYGH
ncbi:uncharacterized protein BJ212DRAFT_69700 [Suillus subaureus]|uniref:Secreted protein n=1 Tax=Suillus subaureus TaxID=48587 RepID=A0A9P7EDS5_9AGAM|nr:uncharacterized protein BJ212DRAFT_69700 [Suillus subaureus]KAG1819041.1 hypothetical protein BJ212DRAFT_69700 [Suillus subaureus]